MHSVAFECTPVSIQCTRIKIFVALECLIGLHRKVKMGYNQKVYLTLPVKLLVDTVVKWLKKNQNCRQES